MKKTKFYFISLFIFCSVINLYGQNKKLDSLWNFFKKANHDTTRIQLLIDIGIENEYENPDSALLYYNKAHDLAIKSLTSLKGEHTRSLESKYIAFQANSLRCIGIVHYNQGNYDTALQYHYKSLKIYEQLISLDATVGKKGMASCFTSIGVVCFEQGEYDKAIENHLKSLKIFEELGFKKGMAICYNNIGLVHSDQGSYDKAIDYFLKSLKIKEEIGDKKGMANCYLNIGVVYKGKSSYDKANENYFKALKIFEEIGDKKRMSQCFNNIGEVKSDQGDNGKAIEYFLKSLKISEELGDKNGIALVYGNIADSHITLADSSLGSLSSFHLKEALKYALKSINLSHEINAIPWENSAANILLKIYTKLGNYKKALEYANIFIATRDSLFKEEKTKSIADAEAKFKSEKKQLEIDKLNKEKELQRSEILRQRLVIVFVIIGLILIAAFAVFVVNRLRITRRQKEKIRIQRDEIEKQRDMVTNQKDRIEKQKHQITQSINYARRIQKAVLLSGENAMNILGEHFILYKPKDIVSGDFYYACRINEWLIVTVADCTGHGVPGAFMSMLGVSFLNEIVRKKEVIRASQVLDHLRESVIEALQQKNTTNEQKDGLDIAFCILNTKTNVLQYAGAFNPLYIVSAKKELKVILPDKQPVAIYEHMKAFTNNELQLNSGDCLYLVSDGFEDQFGGNDDKKFMIKHLKELLVIISSKPMAEQLELLDKTYTDWKGNNEQTDDVTVLGLRIR